MTTNLWAGWTFQAPALKQSTTLFLKEIAIRKIHLFVFQRMAEEKGALEAREAINEEGLAWIRTKTSVGAPPGIEKRGWVTKTEGEEDN